MRANDLIVVKDSSTDLGIQKSRNEYEGCLESILGNYNFFFDSRSQEFRIWVHISTAHPISQITTGVSEHRVSCHYQHFNYTWGGVGSVYVCMCVHVANILLTPSVCGGVCVCMCTCGVIPQEPSTFFETACSQDSLTRCDWLICGFPGSFGLCLPSTKTLVCTTMPGFSDGRSRQNSGPYISTPRILLHTPQHPL